MAPYDVVLKKVEPQTVAAVREVLPTYSDVGRLFGEVFAYLGPQGIRPAGAPMAIYYDAEYRERDADVEAAVPIGGSPSANARVSVCELPGVEHMACVVHHGSYESFSEAYAALMAWIQTNGYRIIGPNREIYLRGPESGGDPSSYVTEVQFPVERV